MKNGFRAVLLLTTLTVFGGCAATPDSEEDEGATGTDTAALTGVIYNDWCSVTAKNVGIVAAGGSWTVSPTAAATAIRKPRWILVLRA